MSTCITTFGKLTKEQIEKDENLKINYSTTDKRDFNISLVDNEKAFAIPYTEDNFYYYKVRTDESLLLFKYLFEKYDLFFADEDYIEDANYVPNYAYSAFYWKYTTDYMLRFDWNDECKARIEAQKNEWQEQYEFFDKIININEMIEIDTLLEEVFSEKNIKEGDLHSIQRFENYTLPSFEKYDYGVPKSLLNKIKNGITQLNQDIKSKEINVTYPEKPKQGEVEDFFK